MNSQNNGLVNLGNTCYMNSAIQCLTHLSIFNQDNNEFMKDIAKRNKDNDEELMIEWINLQNELLNNEKSEPVNPRQFLACFMSKIKKYGFYFESFRQNDCEEFINRLVELLHKSIERKILFQIDGKPENNMDRLAIKAMNTWKTFFESNYSYVISKTYSQLLAVTSCTNCNYVSTNHEPLLVISLEIANNCNSIEDCLSNHIKMDKLDKNNLWRCDKCNQKIQPERKLVFWNLSDILIIQLKRYNSNIEKINKHIKYSELLDMSKYTINYADKDTIYKLVGICIQDGGLNGGHYYSICRNQKNNQWFIYNDSNVTKIDKDDIYNFKPYCLFYKLVN